MLVELLDQDRVAGAGPVDQPQQAVLVTQRLFRRVDELEGERTRGPQRLGLLDRVKVAARRVGGGEAGRGRAQGRVGRLPGPHVRVDAGRDVRVHDRVQSGHHRRGVGGQVDAAAARGAVGHIVVGERAGADVLAADQRGGAVQHPELAVLIAVAVVDACCRVGAKVVDSPARLSDLLDDPALLVADPAGRRAFQGDLNLHARARPVRDDLAQPGILQRVAFEPDALPGLGQQRVQGGEGVVRRDEHPQGGGRGDNLRYVETLQIPTRVPGFAPVDDVGCVLRPIGPGVGVRPGPAGALLQFAIEDLALLPEVGRGAIGVDGRTGPTCGGRVPGFVDEGVPDSLQRCQQCHLPSGVSESQRCAAQVGHGGVGVGAVLAPRADPERDPKSRGFHGAPEPGVGGQG